MTFVLLYSSQLQPPVTEIKTQRENIYVSMQNNRFWGQNVMLYFNVWKEYFNHASLPLCIFMNLTYTSRDPGWLNGVLL